MVMLGCWNMRSPAPAFQDWIGRVVWIVDKEKGCALVGEITELVGISHMFALFRIPKPTIKYSRKGEPLGLHFTSTILVPLHATNIRFWQRWWIRWTQGLMNLELFLDACV